jgi:hypothetical protein
LERRSALCRDVARGHVGAPPYVPYPHRARTPRHRSDHRSLRCVGVDSPVTIVASGPCQVAPIHRTDAPPAARHWPSGRRTSPAMLWPLHACLCHRRDLTNSQPAVPNYKKTSPASASRAHTAARAPPLPLPPPQCFCPAPSPPSPLSTLGYWLGTSVAVQPARTRAFALSSPKQARPRATEPRITADHRRSSVHIHTSHGSTPGESLVTSALCPIPLRPPSAGIARVNPAAEPEG